MKNLIQAMICISVAVFIFAYRTSKKEEIKPDPYGPGTYVRTAQMENRSERMKRTCETVDRLKNYEPRTVYLERYETICTFCDGQWYYDGPKISGGHCCKYVAGMGVGADGGKIEMPCLTWEQQRKFSIEFRKKLTFVYTDLDDERRTERNTP